MRTYEFMLIFDPSVEVTEESAKEAVTKFVGKGVMVKSVEVLGKKRLAYMIDKKSEGTYVLAMLEAQQIKMSDIETKLRLGSNVIRFLLTQK